MRLLAHSTIAAQRQTRPPSPQTDMAVPADPARRRARGRQRRYPAPLQVHPIALAHGIPRGAAYILLPPLRGAKINHPRAGEPASLCLTHCQSQA